MLTLITGTPGAGKTAWTVQELTRLPAQRKLYIHGIPELKIAHEPIYCLSDLCEHCRSLTHLVDYAQDGEKWQQFEEIAKPGQPAYLVEEWPEWASHGSLIVIDEVQRVWRPSSSKVPDEIAALETHRHKGLDFWLISQGPHLFHSNIRLLIGRHIHLVSDWKGRKEFEFPECRQNVTSRSDAVERPYKLPKQIFKLYKSASLHTKQTHRKPLSFYFLCAVLLIVAVLGVKVYKRFSERTAGHDQAQAVAGDAGAQAAAASAPAAPVNVPARRSNAFPDFTPTLKGVPESAPAYAELNRVQDVPHIVGCASTPDWCRCYTSGGAPYPTSPEFCRAYLAGDYFNPWKPRRQGDAVPVPVSSSSKPFPLFSSKSP